MHTYNTDGQENTRSHELSAHSRTACGHFPWGIRKSLMPVKINSCMCGLRYVSATDGDVYPCCKSFKVETDHACMSLALCSFVCPYPHPKCNLVGKRGKPADVPLRETQNYCVGLGYILARCASTPRSLAVALASKHEES